LIFVTYNAVKTGRRQAKSGGFQPQVQAKPIARKPVEKKQSLQV